jgi:hypothetical protein
MDTKIFETEKAAAATADLSQQEPHVEVADLKSSVASSDGERLAAGISTIGLQTKSAVEKAHQRKEDEGGDLDGKETSKKNSFISG